MNRSVCPHLPFLSTLLTNCQIVDEYDDEEHKPYRINHFVKHVGNDVQITPQAHLFLNKMAENDALKGYGTHSPNLKLSL